MKNRGWRRNGRGAEEYSSSQVGRTTSGVAQTMVFQVRGSIIWASSEGAEKPGNRSPRGGATGKEARKILAFKK